MCAAKRKTLEEVLTEQVVTFSNSDRPGEIIGASIERLFSEVVKDVFAPHGSFSSKVRDEIAKALPSNIAQVIELPRYNDLIITALKDRWMDAGVTGDMLRRAEKAIDEVLHDDMIPEFVSLNHLLDAFVEANQEKALEHGWHLPHVTISESDGIRQRYIHILFDAEPEASHRARHGLLDRTRSEVEYANRISVRITGHTDRGHEYGEVYSALLDGEPIGRHFGMTSKWKRQIAAMYFGAAKLIIDSREGDHTYD
ncbi:hypothetical protein [Pseudomonas sp. TWP3-2]|uniref:hypothetical protein n=1 Tax=Pseudomonas sp. TWP3-2 TaxID=2804574 RepID=UPI003CFAFEB4